MLEMFSKLQKYICVIILSALHYKHANFDIEFRLIDNKIIIGLY